MKNRLFFLAVLILPMLMACQRVGKSFESRLGSVETDVTYCRINNTTLKMDLYYPATAPRPLSVIVNVHGGGWVGGDKALGEGAENIPALVKAGYLVASINYRLAPQNKFPAQIEDVKCAIRYLRASADLYHLDVNRIGIMGESAGGHLAVLAALSDSSAGWDVGEYVDQSSRVNAVVDLYGPVDLTDPAFFDLADSKGLDVFGTNDPLSPVLKLANPITYVSSSAPPFLIFHGAEDTYVPPTQSEELYNRLKIFNIPAQFFLVKNAKHGLKPVGNDPIAPSLEKITQRIVDFFNKYLQ
jgi:acetyl esterase/lipase